jgi:small subunit ribosomal protein S1
MPNDPRSDELKQKFRPDQTALDQEVDAAMAGLSIDDLYAFDKPQPGAEAAAAGPAGGPAPGHVPQKGFRRGRVISVTKDDAFVDFGGKSQGIVSLMQFLDAPEPPKVGDEFDFHVDRYDEREGLLILSRKGATATNVSWENLEIGQVIEGTVTGMNKGGLELEVKNMRAFMPSGQVDLYFQKDISTFIGQRVKAEVTQFDAHAKNLIVSRRNVLEREKEEAKKALMEELAEGQMRRGTVRSVTDFGAFVDLGGVDGLLHVSEMSFRRGRHPSEFVKVGDVVDVKLVKLDKATGKLSLSLKQAMADPWTGAETRYPVGTALTGRVTRVPQEGFGAFVEVEEGLEGLLPVSEMSWQRIRHPNDVVKEGDTHRLVVIAMDPSARKLTFSLKQAGPDPWKDVKDRYAQDMVVSGNVTRVVDFGAFIELEPGLEGLVHISELDAKRVRASSDVVKPGQEVKVRVLEVDPEARRMSLSIRRAAEPAPAPAGATAGAASAAPATPEPLKKPKKRPPLKGGLDWGW